MTAFALPKRYDESIANEGVTFSITDENDNYWGDFTCKHLDEFSQRGELAYKRIRAKYAAQIRSKKLNDYDAIKVVFCEASLVNWSGIVDAKGKEVPFSLETALEYFGLDGTKWLLVHLSRLASDMTNYAAKVEEETASDTVEGN